MVSRTVSKRMSSSRRTRLFKSVWLTQMGKCEHCGVSECLVWRKGGLSGSYSDEGLQQIVWRTSNLELDHIEPLHRGGSNEFENLQLLCIECHKAKSAKERSERARAFA